MSENIPTMLLSRPVPFRPRRFAASLLRSPSVTIARHLLVGYMRSGWLWGEVACVLALYAVYFSVFAGNMAYFFGTAGDGLGALAVLSAAIFTHRAVGARMYLTLAHIPSRATYVRGLILACGVLRIPMYLLLLGLALLTHRIAGAMPLPALLAGTIGLLANCVVLAALTVTLSPPIATRTVRIVFLLWLALALYSFQSGIAPAWVHLPLVPLGACYTFGASATIGWSGCWALLVAAGYVAGLTLLAQFWLARHDLLLH